MSVVIRGMKMPTSCSECAVCGYYGKGDHVCDITGKDVVYELSLEKRRDDCPLVELPAQHGRLIDALEIDEVKWVHPDTAWQMGWNSAIDAILENAQTIIEAEEGGE